MLIEKCWQTVPEVYILCMCIYVCVQLLIFNILLSLSRQDRPVFESVLYSLEECESAQAVSLMLHFVMIIMSCFCHEVGQMEYGELKITKEVGSGGFGVVFQGFWNPKKAEKLLVAIKNLPLGVEREVHTVVLLCPFSRIA